MDNLERAKYVITYLEQENKKLSDKQVLMKLEILKIKQQGDKEELVTLTPIVMKLAQEKIEKIDQRLRIQPLRGGNLL